MIDFHHEITFAKLYDVHNLFVKYAPILMRGQYNPESDCIDEGLEKFVALREASLYYAIFSDIFSVSVRELAEKVNSEKQAFTDMINRYIKESVIIQLGMPELRKAAVAAFYESMCAPPPIRNKKAPEKRPPVKKKEAKNSTLGDQFDEFFKTLEDEI